MPVERISLDAGRQGTGPRAADQEQAAKRAGSALVQVTHTTSQQHADQKLQARQQIARQAQSLDQALGR